MLVELPVIFTKQSEDKVKITYILGSVTIFNGDLNKPDGINQWVIIEEDFDYDGNYTGCSWLITFLFRYLIPLNKTQLKEILFDKKQSTVMAISDYFLK
jgi:predicted RNA-binding protein